MKFMFKFEAILRDLGEIVGFYCIFIFSSSFLCCYNYISLFFLSLNSLYNLLSSCSYLGLSCYKFLLIDLSGDLITLDFSLFIILFPTFTYYYSNSLLIIFKLCDIYDYAFFKLTNFYLYYSSLPSF
jgi:hypothetical protein